MRSRLRQSVNAPAEPVWPRQRTGFIQPTLSRQEVAPGEHVTDEEYNAAPAR
jgi:hypothetical protein